SLTVDGTTVQVPKGELLIKAAQEHGTYIPRFCWHERMKPVGMCRMCLVEIEGVRGLPPACTTPVADGMVVTTRSDAVTSVRDGILELFLINHPLDCPVCDRGGECPLQDTTLAFGPGESRFTEEKRHWEKPIPISDLVLLDRERCIQCARCTRFADEIAGDPLITFNERGGYTEIATFPDEPFSSYFSGNTVQICPVGALTAKPYRFKARPWDLSAVETSCTACSMHCRGALESSSNRLVRLLGVDSDAVNHGWLCDKGRFGYEAIHHEDRVRHPMVRRDGELVECSWPEALDVAAEGLRNALAGGGASSIGVLGGARGTNEDAYVWARFAKGVLRTDNVDAQLGDGIPAEVALGLAHATISDLDTARGIVVLGVDLKEEIPVLALRARRAATELGVPLIEMNATATGLAPDATARLRYAPGEQAEMVAAFIAALDGTASGDAAIDAAAAALAGRDGDLVVVVGRGNLAERVDATVAAIAPLAAREDTKFLVALRRSNVRGALDLGLAPGFLPGRVALEDGRDWYEEAWGTVPSERGLDALGILDAAANGAIDALVLLGVDPHDDCPDRDLAHRGLTGAKFLIAVDTFLTDSTRGADVFLPVTAWGEQDGTVTNVEGRVQRVTRKISADGTAMPDWRVAVELALRLREDFDLATAAEVQDEIARVAPAFAGVDASLLRRARDGVVLPLVEHAADLVLDRLSIPLTDASWEPIAPGQVDPEADSTAVAESAAADDDAPTGDADTAADAGETPVADDGPEVPALHVWDRASATPTRPARDAYALRLVSSRTLYDGGVMTSATPAFGVLVPAAELRVNPHDHDRVGVPDGAAVRVTSARGQLDLPIRADRGVPAGSAVLVWNAPGQSAGALIDAAAVVTDVRVESIR
ncbi:MAG: NADH-quinone oxidoreductase subunit NuoG, partial [Acidimicrobiia bacterium]|nr:NADH-quinone oxidoreductase subunit NuoG [Acidimicrobiia bacterium]